MHTPGDFGSAGGGAPAGRDETIRRLLPSDDQREVMLALAELDQGYRWAMAHWLMYVSGLKVQDADVGEIWKATTDSLVKMARRDGDGFHKIGSLTKLLQTIARRRAIDHYNAAKGMPVVGDLDWVVANDPDVFDQAFDRSGSPEELWKLVIAMMEGITLLSELEQPVFNIRLKMSLQLERPPTIKELTVEFNQITGNNLTESTIKGRIQHGRPALRKYLQSKGFLDE